MSTDTMPSETVYSIPDHVPFAPLERQDGYLPLGRHGLIGDGTTCALEAWRVIQPVLDAWERNDVPLLEYEAGSNGPTD